MKHKDGTELTPSERNYLRAVYHLSRRVSCPYVRPADVAAYNGVSRPSVTTALGRLQERGLIGRSPPSGVFLTEKGHQAATSMMQRFSIIALFLENILHIGKETAKKDAWSIEYVVSNQTVEKLSQFLKENERKEKAYQR